MPTDYAVMLVIRALWIVSRRFFATLLWGAIVAAQVASLYCAKSLGKSRAKIVQLGLLRRMISLTKSEALAFFSQRGEIIDSPDNAFNLFSTTRWLRHFVREMIDDQKIIAFEAKRGGASALLLCMQRVAGSRAYYSITNYYGSLCTPIHFLNANAEQSVELIDDLAHQIVSARPRLETIRLHPFADDDLPMQVLCQALRRRGWFARTYRSFGNWSEPTAGVRFDQYVRNKTNALMQSWDRRAQRVETAKSSPISMRIVSRPDEVSAAMGAYESVYAASWKPKEPFPDFVRNWAHELAAHGELRLGLAFVGSEPAAAQFWVVAARRAHIFKVAYHAKHARHSLGNILTARMFRHAMDVDLVEEIDYLSGDDTYKEQWMSVRKQRVGIVASNPRTAVGFVSAARETAGALRQRLFIEKPLVSR